MANLSHYGSDNLVEVNNQDNMPTNLIHQDVQAPSTFEKSTILTQSDTEITSDSNIISYSQYMNESQYNTVQNSSLPALQDDLILSVIEQLKTQVVNCIKINQDNKHVNELLIAELESTTIVEVPKELPKVSMVNSSLKKLESHLASFDMVVKERTTATDIMKGTWGFEHTKACFRDDIIPFAVEQHCDEKNKVQDKMKNVLKDNDRLLAQALSVDIVNIVVYDHKNNTFSEQSAPTFAESFEINDLKAQSQAKDTVILKLKERLQSLSALKETLSKQTGNANEALSLHYIDPKLLKLDVTPLAPKLRSNRTVYTDYMRHTQKETATLREIVKSERLLNPLNTSLDYACKYTKRIQELLVILNQTCPYITDLGTKLVAVTPKNNNKHVRLTEHIPLSGNTPVKTTPSTNVVANTPVLSSTGVTLLSSASGSKPQGNTKNDRI
uniref:Integrase, catalytic region, zinc finger, CCHC-type, peptidase aspartic, catalytic n=1 Tax=Tanacetum cinerariifolium TaxID=118510 RepID=A0A6L2KJ44_TANCI|nr:hypothetical protein [Tanacetum cinerariifolium]